MRTYSRDESTVERLDRNWAELVQELRVIGTGVQILFAFILSIAFQARFACTSRLQRMGVYRATVFFSTPGLSAAIFIAPVALHRALFRFGEKDEIVGITNTFAQVGMAVLALAMLGAVLLVSDWVSGSGAAAVCTSIMAVVILAGWLVLPTWLRRRAEGGASKTAARHVSGA